jgi:membrane associated rhomboid family serine protease
MVLQENIPDTLKYTSSGEHDDGWLVIARGGISYIQNCSLVLSAVGIEHQIDPNSGVILSRDFDSDRAISEITACEEENRYWPPPPEHVQEIPRTENPPTLLMIGGLILFYMVTGGWFSGNPWFQAGAVNSEKILAQGQWWRLITALTLHADQVHLVGNCVIGAFMVHLLCKTIGYGTGWLALLLSGMAGNLLNIILRQGPHHSVGFSTAIFAAIGIFCGLQLAIRKATLIQQLLLPLGAGAGLLAMLGTQGEHTDLGAHLFGFACGLVCGLLLQGGHLDKQAGRNRFQGVLFAISLILVTSCWFLALAAH